MSRPVEPGSCLVVGQAELHGAGKAWPAYREPATPGLFAALAGALQIPAPSMKDSAPDNASSFSVALPAPRAMALQPPAVNSLFMINSSSGRTVWWTPTTEVAFLRGNTRLHDQT